MPETLCSGSRGTAQHELQLLRSARPASRARSERRSQPPPEEDFGGGDFCSLQEQASTDDDQPLD